MTVTLMVLSAAVFAAVSGVSKTFFEVEQTLLDLEIYWINFHKMWQNCSTDGKLIFRTL